MSDTDPPAAEWDLVMPFVVCASQGGPFEDQAFVAGYQAGLLDAKLAAAPPETESMLFDVNAGLGPQVELLAMRHGFHLVEIVSAAEGWITARLNREGQP